MTKYIILVFFAVSACYFGCSDSITIHPDDCNGLPCDTCETYTPISSWDSLYDIPRSRYTISKVAYNVKRSQLIGKVYYGLSRSSFSGVFIYNDRTRETTLLSLWSYCLFSDGERMIMELPGWNGLGIYDLRTHEGSKITAIPDGFTSPSLSLDEKYIFADSSYATFRISIGDWSIEALSDSLDAPVQLDERHLIGITRLSKPRYGIRTLNLETKTLEWIDFVGLPENMNWGVSKGRFSLSPDRKRILMDVASAKGIWDKDNAGLFLLDIPSRTARKILPAQYWAHHYTPTWSSNTTFFASYHCRKDTTAMLFEYDLNGKVLRQVTFKEMKLYP